MDTVKNVLNIGLLTVLTLAAALATACLTVSEAGVPDIEQRATALNKSIMCPVCPGESIDQSQNSLSIQMRSIVRDKLGEGWTDRQIKDFLVERYGPSVLMEPPTSGFNLAAWVVPPVAFALAVVALLLTLKWMRMSAEAERQAEEETARDRGDYVSRIEDALNSDDSDEATSERRADGLSGGNPQQ